MVDIYLITLREDYFRGLGWDKFMDCQQALASLEFLPEMGVDTETTGLNTFLKEKVNSIQIGIPGKQYVFDLETIPPGILKRPLEEKLLLGHNLGFDLPHLYNLGIFPKKIYDSFVAETLLTLGLQLPRGARGLKNVVSKYLGRELDKSMQEDICYGINSVEAITYAGTDVADLFEIREEQMKVANRLKVHRRIEKECDATLGIAYTEFCGACIDMEYLYEHVRNYEYEEWGMYKTLREKHGDVNWNSPKQVAPILKAHGIEEYNEETGNAKTGEEVLAKYSHIEIARDLLKYREFSKQVSTYGRKWFGYVQKDGRIHTRFKQLVKTGRMASGDSKSGKRVPWAASVETDRPFPNFQNMPAKTMRGIIVAGKGNVLISADYTSQESVILADQSQDPVMLKFFKEDGGDIYSFVAKNHRPELSALSYAEIKEQFPDIRQLYKSVALLIPYGGDWHTIAGDLNCPLSEAKELYDGYMSTFYTLPDFFKRCYEFTATHGYVPNDPLFGGKTFYNKGREFKEIYNDKQFKFRYFKERDLDTEWYRQINKDLAWYFMLQNNFRKESVNYRIQGTGAVMMKLALIYFYSYIQQHKLHGKVLIINAVHDEILVECSKKIAEKIAKVLQQCMEKAGNECLKNLTISAVPEIMDRWKK